LKAASIPYSGDGLDPTGIKVRFADLETQLKARTSCQDEARSELHRSAESAVASPQWLTAIGAKPMYLGLDLRGGVHFLLQVDMKAALDKAGDRYTTDIRSLLREKKVQYSGVAREGPERRRALSRRSRADEGAQRDRKGFPRSAAARRRRRRRAADSLPG
jgi:preprotein translocase subunit SecD